MAAQKTKRWTICTAKTLYERIKVSAVINGRTLKAETEKVLEAGLAANTSRSR